MTCPFSNGHGPRTLNKPSGGKYAAMTECEVCGKPAREIVDKISRRTRKVISSYPVCTEHAQVEINLAVTGLSMVDIDLRRIDPS